MSEPSILRRMWQPPGRYEDRALDRRVTFLELFFDLVFVVVISQLGRRLSGHPSWAGVGWFIFLFYAVWSCWLNGTLYHDLHTTNDVSVRVFTFAQMLAVACMAVFVGDVPGDGATGFALAYAANTLVLVVLWFRTGLHDPHHRPGSMPYSAGYLASAVLFAVSPAFEGPVTYWLWVVALAAQVIGWVVGMHRWTPPANQQGEAIIATTPSLVERMGLFVIIVLGEVIVGAVNGMADLHPLHADGIVIGLLGVVVAIGLWWIYFDLVSHRPPVPRWTQVWLNLHFPLVVAIAAGGAAVLNTVEQVGEQLPDDVRWLLVGFAGRGADRGHRPHRNPPGASHAARALSGRRGRASPVRSDDARRRPHGLGGEGQPDRDGGPPARAGRGGRGRVAQARRVRRGLAGVSLPAGVERGARRQGITPPTRA